MLKTPKPDLLIDNVSEKYVQYIYAYSVMCENTKLIPENKIKS